MLSVGFTPSNVYAKEPNSRDREGELTQRSRSLIFSTVISGAAATSTTSIKTKKVVKRTCIVVVFK